MTKPHFHFATPKQLADAADVEVGGDENPKL
jgi:hypothetical protein